MEILVQQQFMTGHLIGRLSSETKERISSYAEIASTSFKPPTRERSRSRQRKVHNVMIYPKEEGTSLGPPLNKARGIFIRASSHHI
ncbi:hypothetical protein AVEN_267682-1 [Araneus ventricosus]|uniref:Uncharacterized protein n=1 Tax=Araneus ventricosus TaxID=182803 RepID=A0A4Y2N3X4_ARAVE|nr:hypothetical protein AVEN_267682-1 [Araneus ventricosus]